MIWLGRGGRREGCATGHRRSSGGGDKADGKRREEAFKEFPRLRSIKAQSSLNLALTSTLTLH